MKKRSIFLFAISAIMTTPSFAHTSPSASLSFVNYSNKTLTVSDIKSDILSHSRKMEYRVCDHSKENCPAWKVANSKKGYSVPNKDYFFARVVHFPLEAGASYSASVFVHFNAPDQKEIYSLAPRVVSPGSKLDCKTYSSDPNYQEGILGCGLRDLAAYISPKV